MSLNTWNAETQELEQVAGNANINDSDTSTESTWSSEKINDSLVDLESELESAREIFLESAVDLNTLLENGIYIPKSDTIGNNCTNIPTTPAYTFALKVYGGSVKFQEFSCTNGTFKRKYYNGAWQGDWQELATMDKVSNITKKTTSSGTTTFSLNGRIINNIFLGADGSNQYNIMTYIYNSAVCIREIGGKTIPSNITFTKNGNNIDMKVPAYWLVYIS